jgi:hypothetical protein
MNMKCDAPAVVFRSHTTALAGRSPPPGTTAQYLREKVHKRSIDMRDDEWKVPLLLILWRTAGREAGSCHVVCQGHAASASGPHNT